VNSMVNLCIKHSVKEFKITFVSFYLWTTNNRISQRIVHQIQLYFLSV